MDKKDEKINVVEKLVSYRFALSLPLLVIFLISAYAIFSMLK